MTFGGSRTTALERTSEPICVDCRPSVLTVSIAGWILPEKEFQGARYYFETSANATFGTYSVFRGGPLQEAHSALPLVRDKAQLDVTASFSGERY